jgi:delta-aminolevulinic acid dehydratase/porphobilinogen synthase
VARRKYGAPASAHQPGDEYSTIMAAANNGWLDG